MAELQARYENLESSAQSIWRNTLPEGQEVTIGRRSQADLEVPEWNRSEWVVDDPRISGRHVTVQFDGKQLRVRRRLEPAERPAINPIFYNGRATDDFQVGIGESFTIGSTTFTLQPRNEIPEGSDESQEKGFTRTIAKEDLRISAFVDAKSPLLALADFPEIIRNTREDGQLEDRFLDVILKGLPLAEFAGIVQMDVKAGEGARAAVIRSKQRGLTSDDFRVSNRLVRRATQDVIESVLYVWDKKAGASADFSATMTPGADWAICTPLDERPNRNRAIYVAGRSPKTIVSEDQLRRESEFLDFQKFINLASDLFCTMRDSRRIERQNSLLRGYLPKTLIKIMEQQVNLKEVLARRVANVTALFCDLRGSSRFAQENTDMLVACSRMSDALDMMTNQIHEQEGVIGGLQGDAAVGFWGWPESNEQQIDQAVKAALGIRKDFARLNSKACGPPVFSCGIGMAFGPGVVGQLGTYHQFKLDAYGSVMNLAARLESLTKHLGVQILVDQAIADRVLKTDPNQRMARIRSMGKFQPAGMTMRVPIFELMPPAHEADACDNGTNYELWEVGMRAFLAGNWDVAQTRFSRFERSLSDERAAIEKAARFFVDFIATRNNKPPENWDGTIEMDMK